MKAQDIIIRPVITEKSNDGLADKKYTFEVHPDANKIEIAKAVEEIFGVQVKKVNMCAAECAVRAASRATRSPGRRLSSH